MTRGSHRSLDWFSFFLADIQAGFGPFVAIYLTAHSWTQLDIGLVLTASGLVALAGQLPAGALVDAVRSARLVAGVALLAICASAAHHGRMARVPGRAQRACHPCGGKLRVGSCDRRHQPQSCRPRRAWRTDRAQRALRIDRRGRFRRRDGGVRLLAVRPVDPVPDRDPGHTSAVRAGAGANARRGTNRADSAARRGRFGTRGPCPAAVRQPAAARSSRPASRCSSSPMRRCSRSWAAF